MKRLAHSFAWYLYWTLAFILALLAASLVAAKFLFEDIHSYRADIERVLSESIEAQVMMGGIEGQWNGWVPQLELKSLAIDQSIKHPGLSLGLVGARLELDPAESIKKLSPVFSIFEFDGLTIRYDLRQGDNESNASAADIVSSRPSENSNQHQAKEKTSNAGILAFLLSQSNIDVKGTRIELISQAGDELSIAPIDFQMRHDGVMHQLKVGATLEAQTTQAQINFVAEVEGDPAKKPVSFYMNVDKVDQTLLNPWLGLADLTFDQFEGSQQLWGESYRGRLTYVASKTSVSNFKMGDYALETFEVDTALLRRDHSYQLQVLDLNIEGAAQKIELPLVSLDLKREGRQLLPVRLTVDRLDLEKLSEWSKKQPFTPAEVTEALIELAPEGAIENVHVTWADPNQISSFKLEADLDKTGISDWEDIPEIRGIDGLLQMDSKGGAVHLSSKKFLAHFPTLFNTSWEYEDAGGIINWTYSDEGVTVASQLLHLKDQHLSASGRFHFFMPYDYYAQPSLHLQIGLKNSDGRQAPNYIPPEEIGRETYDWITDAVKSGDIKQAGFILNGVTRTRLSDYQDPVVQLFMEVENANFEYLKGWPSVNNANAFVYFRNGELIAEASKGQLYDSNIEQAWVYLPESTDRILIHGQTSGEAQDIHRLLTESDLKEAVGDDLKEWRMEGKSLTRVDINIPFSSELSPEVEVITYVSEGRFASEEAGIDFSGIEGEVAYSSEKGLSSQRLDAVLFENPLTAEITTAQDKTQIFMNSAIKADTLGQWLEFPLDKIAKGLIRYQARLDMCPEEACNQLVISSDLKGVSLDALAPLGKDAQTESSLTIVSDLGRAYSDGRSAIRFNLDQQLRGVIIGKDQTLDRAKFTLGGARPSVPKQPGIWVDGQLERLDLEELQAFVANFSEDNRSDKGPSSHQGQTSALKRIELKIGEVSFKDNSLKDVRGSLVPEAQGMSLSIQSNELSGNLWLPEDENEVYKVKLSSLVLNQQEEDSVEESADQESALTETINVKDIPKVDVSIDALTLRNKPMGRWQFVLRPTEQGAVIENLEADMFGTSIKGGARWEKGLEEMSDITLKLDSDDFGKVLSAWGLEKALETKTLKSYLQLSWPGAPWDFELSQTDGELQFTAKNGRLIDVGQSGNFLRVFGILNLQSLGRRMRLDFSDLFESGVAFDEMKASYTIKEGIAETSEPFMMTGPSANLAMQGRLDLVNETVDKEMEVALPVTDNIPLVSVLLGAPQVAGAVFLFDKLIGDPLAKFTTVKYQLSGDWGDPQIDLGNEKEKARTIPVEDVNDN